jgi:hypothetical protein
MAGRVIHECLDWKIMGRDLEKVQLDHNDLLVIEGRLVLGM